MGMTIALGLDSLSLPLYSQLKGTDLRDWESSPSCGRCSPSDRKPVACTGVHVSSPNHVAAASFFHAFSRQKHSTRSLKSLFGSIWTLTKPLSMYVPILDEPITPAYGSFFIKERSASYERALREKSQIIRQIEMRNMNRKERSTLTWPH